MKQKPAPFGAFEGASEPKLANDELYRQMWTPQTVYTQVVLRFNVSILGC